MWVLIAIAAIAIAFWEIKFPSLRGRAGERRLRRELASILDGGTYRFLHDLTLPDYDGTAQIDHVLVSPFGVFVIETKNYSGWIYGSEDQRTWTHAFHQRKYSFQNPLRQSYNHIKAVQSATNLRSDQIHSLVVFVGKGEFKTRMPDNVIQIRGLKRYFWGKSNVVLSDSQIETVVDQIEKRRFKRGILTNWRHRRHIREILRTPDCPKCRKRMVVRTAKRGPYSGGQFCGCPRYPECNGVRSVDR